MCPSLPLTVVLDPVRPPSADDRVAAALRGFGPIGIVAILLILAGAAVVAPLRAVFVLIWAWLSRTPWREIGFVRPRSWPATLAAGVAIGVALKFTMKAIVMPMLGADPINQAVRHLTGNTAALPGALFALVVGAGFGEEVLFRGYFFERFGKLFGTGAIAKVATVLVTTTVFGLAHYDFQGVPGVQQATIVGLVFGTVYAMTARLWFLIVTHAAFDLTALAMIYWNLEWDVAHLVFK